MFGHHSGSGGFSPLWLLVSVIIGASVSATQCSPTQAQPNTLSFRHTTVPPELPGCGMLGQQRATNGTSTYPRSGGAVLAITSTIPSVDMSIIPTASFLVDECPTEMPDPMGIPGGI